MDGSAYRKDLIAVRTRQRLFGSPQILYIRDPGEISRLQALKDTQSDGSNIRPPSTPSLNIFRTRTRRRLKRSVAGGLRMYRVVDMPSYVVRPRFPLLTPFSSLSWRYPMASLVLARVRCLAIIGQDDDVPINLRQRRSGEAGGSRDIAVKYNSMLLRYVYIWNQRT